MSSLDKKLSKLRQTVKMLEDHNTKSLLYINTVLLSVRACVRMMDYEADDEERVDKMDLQLSSEKEGKELLLVEDWEIYSEDCARKRTGKTVGES